MNNDDLSELIEDISRHLLFDGYGGTEEDYIQEDSRIKKSIRLKIKILKNENHDLYESIRRLDFAKNLARGRMMINKRELSLREICFALAAQDIEVNDIDDYKIYQNYKYFDILKETDFKEFEAVYREERKRLVVHTTD